MYREIRRKSRVIEESEARSILNRGEYGILSTADDDGQPYAIPVNYAVIGNEIFIHSAIEGHKLDNIKLNHKVSFCVVGKTELLPEKFSIKYESAIIFGSAEILTDDNKREPLLALVKKYSGDYIKEGEKYIDASIDKTAIIKVSIEHITGKALK